MVDAEAEQLARRLPPNVRLLVVADHGMVDSPASSSRIDVDDRPELRDGVALLGGEARFRHLYCQRGAVDDVVATWSETSGRRALRARPGTTPSRRGWFGPVTARRAAAPR